MVKMFLTPMSGLGFIILKLLNQKWERMWNSKTSHLFIRTLVFGSWIENEKKIWLPLCPTFIYLWIVIWIIVLFTLFYFILDSILFNVFFPPFEVWFYSSLSENTLWIPFHRAQVFFFSASTFFHSYVLCTVSICND